jgi:hypothetical protein
MWEHANVADPYGIYPDCPEVCIGRVCFARPSGSDVWVCFADPPEATVKALREKQELRHTVQELLELVEGSGLRFQGWLDNAPYNIGFPDQDVESLCKDFPDRDRWSIAEGLTMLRLTTHNFLACRPERDKNSQIDFSGERWLSYFPTRHPSAAFSRWAEGKFTREGYEFDLSSAEAVLFVEADGRQAVSALLKHKRLAAMAQGERFALARAFYERMWRHGHMFFSAVPVKAHSNRR